MSVRLRRQGVLGALRDLAVTAASKEKVLFNAQCERRELDAADERTESWLDGWLPLAGPSRQFSHELWFFALALSSKLNRRVRRESRFGTSPPAEATASKPHNTHVAMVGLSSVSKWLSLPATTASFG